MPIAAKDNLSAHEVSDLFEYNPVSGVLFWKKNIGKRRRAGTIAGCIKDSGYVRIQFDGKVYLAHRLAWVIYNGSWPNGYIDHINGDRADNRIENLRSVTHQQNTMNSSIRSHNTTGFKGVHRQKYGFCARIVLEGKRIRLGYFKTAEEAHQAYAIAAKKYHGEFANIKNNATVSGL